MLPERRRQRIVDQVTKENGCSVEELATTFDVSKATIRRDLDELESEGDIERSHGGALPATTVGREQKYSRKEIKNIGAKQAIASRAVEELKDGSVAFLDAGSTTLQVAKRIGSGGPTIVATNSLDIAMELEEVDTDVKVTGGTLRTKSGALVGPTGESFLERTNFDVACLGTNALDAEQGLLTPNESEARMKRLMAEAAENVVVLADGSKFGKRSFVQFASLSDVDLLVTDAQPKYGLEEALEDAEVSVEVADE